MVAISGCSAGRKAAPPPPAKALAQSIKIIRTATPQQPHVLRVLFYGQSISTKKWTDQALAQLVRRYPNVRFDTRNLAIGGFPAQHLEYTVDRDVTAFYPDLIVFHVYGDQRAYERIIRTIRSKTAADLIVQTDHISDTILPDCDEGFHASLARRPGCTGRLWYRSANWESHMSWHVVPALAARYGFGIEPRRDEWLEYLNAHRMPFRQLLADKIHPNGDGWTLTANLLVDWFARAVASWHGEQSDLVRDLPPPRAAGPTVLNFTGNRIELIATGPLDGKVHALIDGKATNMLDGCWQTSRATSVPGVPPWPAVRQVIVAPSDHEADRWTATLTGINADQTQFKFDLTSERHGPDGSGEAGKDFASPSGRVSIAAKGWTLADAFALKGLHAPDRFQVQWRRAFVCRDQAPVTLNPGAIEQRHLIATGLTNGVHKLSLTIYPGAVSALRAIRVYRPSLDRASS